MIRSNIFTAPIALSLCLFSCLTAFLTILGSEAIAEDPAKKPPALGGAQSKAPSHSETDEQKAAKLRAACAAFDQLAQQFLDGRHDEEALSYTDHVINLSPKDARAYYLRAFALARLQRFDAASDDIDKAIALYPNQISPETKNCHALRLEILQKLGQNAKAAEEEKKFSAYLKGTPPPDIKATMQMSEISKAYTKQTRWHPNKPLPMINPNKKNSVQTQATQQP